MAADAERRALSLQLIGAMQRERAIASGLGLPPGEEEVERPQRRTHRRYHYPVLAVHTPTGRFQTHDWSLSGMRVLGVHAQAASRTPLPVQISLANAPDQRFDAKVVIVRSDPHRELAGLRFESFSRPCYDFLRKLEHNIANGLPLR